eukprot:m51a1_g11809 putative dna helicase mcm8 isoform x2 (272) ;mRNA; r:356100-356967
MPAPLLSRFDLVYILIDKPDEAKDRMLSEHVMALHKGKEAKKSLDTMGCSGVADGDLDGQSQGDMSTAASLEQRLRDKPPGFDPIPPQLLRKYIGYARKYVHPRLTEGARALLRDFYLDLRRKSRSDTSTPVTNRQLESLIRLTEARAKIELREDAGASDARDAIAIMRSALENRPDSFGAVPCIDFRSSGRTTSRAKLATQFVGVITAEAKRRGSSLYTFRELSDIARDRGFAAVVGDFGGFVDLLNNQGFLLKSPNGWRLATCSLEMGR